MGEESTSGGTSSSSGPGPRAALPPSAYRSATGAAAANCSAVPRSVLP